MINIIERASTKVPGRYSFYISFNYNEEIIVDLKTLDCYNYNRKTHEWEIPLGNLSIAIDKLSHHDDITLETLSEQSIQEIVYDIGPFKTNLFQHQLDAIQYGLNHEKWLLLDPPGLGKTASMIGLAQELKAKRNLSHCLVICGINTLKTNWKEEISKHSNLSARILGERVNRKGKYVIDGVQKRIEQLKNPIDEFFVITNIETLRNDDVAELLNDGPNKFDMVIVDEIHCCKSNTSLQGSNLLKLKDATYKIGLTGTLIINNPLDCFMAFKWLGIEHCESYVYKHYYCIFDEKFNKFIKGYQHLDYIVDEIKDSSLRREKSIINLPPITIIEEKVDMNNDHKQFYEDLVQGIVSDIDKVKIKKKSLLALWTRLRQATACPDILSTHNISASKIDRAKSLIESIISNNEKIVVFSTFKSSAERLYKELKDLNYRVVLCTGDSSENHIATSIDGFQNKDAYDILICTWQKMGTGITLTAATYGIFIDTPQTAAEFEQAYKRIYRLGTTRPVFIYVLVCPDTVDEKVQTLLHNKNAFSNYMLDEELSDSEYEIIEKYLHSLK